MIHRATDDTLDLEIRILQRQEQGYPVELTLAGQQEFPHGYLAADILPWSSSGDLAADGRNLFEALFKDSTLREAWGRVRGQSPQRRIRLRTDPPELNVVPWELLNDGTAMLSAQADAPFSRYLPIALRWRGEITERPIRALVAISNPDDLETKYNLPQVDAALEREALKGAFSGLPGVQVDFLDEPVTLERMEEKLRQGYHVLHFIGHGAFSVKRQQAALYLQDTLGHAARVLDDDMAGMLARHGVRPRLVFLAACQSAMRSSADAFLGLGPKLVKAGVPAVVAMQDFVLVETARKFSGVFYRRLMEHGQVDLATNEARSTLLTAGRPDAAVPVLFMRIESGLLWSERMPQVVHEYLSALRDYCASLPYLTLHDIRSPKTLDEVYVPLKAKVKVEVMPEVEAEDKGDEERAMRERQRSEPLSIAEVMQQRDQPHVLILGEPGAGKSTLLRQLAERAWDSPEKIGLDASCLPILIPLRRLAALDGSLEERLNRALTGELALTQDLPQGFFTQWPNQTGANWLLLLDALDEVPAEQRPHLMDWFKRILKTVGPNRIVMTSRPSGYSPGELDDKLFGHYDLLPFTPEQTGQFALHWFDHDQTKADRFLQELDRVRARDLRGTPLLLTIAAKVYLEKGTLPERRSALYGQFVDIWLAEAEQRGWRAELNEAVCEVARFALARLALAMTEQPTQSEALLSQIAAAYLRDAVPLSADRAHVVGERFVRVMARRSGVFTRRGNAYDFIHPTFREYLAARAIVRECKQDGRYDLGQIWERLVSRWADENWREVALFALGILSNAEQDATALIGRAWRKGEKGLRFAGIALAEQVKVKTSLSDGIIDALLVGAREAWRWDWSIPLLGELPGYPRASEGLLALARDEKVYGWVRERAAVALGRLGRAEEAVSILLTLARNEKKADVRARAAEALGKLGRAEEAVSILLALACDEKVYTGARVAAATALGRLGRAEEAASILLALACDEKVDERVREQAAAELGYVGRTEEAAPILLALARDEEVDADVRVNAAAALGELGRAEEAVSILLALARDEKVGERVQERAAAALGELGRADDLLALARNEKVGKWVRACAAEVLGELGRADDLLALARNEKVDVWTRERAAETLGELGRAEEAAPILLALAHDEKVDVWTREQAAAGLGRVGRTEEAAPILLALARDEKVDKWVRARAAEVLGEFADVRVLYDLERIAQEDKDENVRWAAQEAIEQIRRRA